MATQLYGTSNYAAFEVRGGGIVLRHLNSNAEVFFQPGDDAQAVRDTITALAEVRATRRDAVFDIVMSEYI